MSGQQIKITEEVLGAGLDAVTQARSAFEAAGPVSDAVSDAVGYAPLAHELDGFADNWRIARGSLTTSMRGLEANIREAQDQLAIWDKESVPDPAGGSAAKSTEIAAKAPGANVGGGGGQSEGSPLVPDREPPVASQGPGAKGPPAPVDGPAPRMVGITDPPVPPSIPLRPGEVADPSGPPITGGPSPDHDPAVPPGADDERPGSSGSAAVGVGAAGLGGLAAGVAGAGLLGGSSSGAASGSGSGSAGGSGGSLPTRRGSDLTGGPDQLDPKPTEEGEATGDLPDLAPSLTEAELADMETVDVPDAAGAETDSGGLGVAAPLLGGAAVAGGGAGGVALHNKLTAGSGAPPEPPRADSERVKRARESLEELRRKRRDQYHSQDESGDVS